MNQTIGPVTTSERLEFLDVLRGFAIFGMFTVNMTADLNWAWMFNDQFLNSSDKIVLFIIDMFTNGKFITIFSFLFAVGFCIQLQRAQERNTPFIRLYLRRLIGLFFIGAVAIILGLNTYILIDYATWGLVLVWFYNRSSRFLISSMVIFLTIQFTAGAVLPTMEKYQQAQKQLVAQVDIPETIDTDAMEKRKVATRVYSEGSFTEVVRYRAKRLLKYLISWHYVYDIELLGFMVAAIYFVRCGVLWDSDKRCAFARKILPWLLGIGVLGWVIHVILKYFVKPGPQDLLLTLLNELSIWPLCWPAMGLGYAAIIVLLLKKTRYQKLFRPFVAVGRLALTNYLFTCIAIALVTYDYFLGWYGEMKPLSGLLIVLGVFPLQVLLSNWWIARFRFGPAEWVWRSITYMKLQPFR